MKWKGLDIDPRLISESTVVKPHVPVQPQVKEMTTESGVRYLLPQIEAIHAGATRNNTRYLADKLKGNVELKSGVFSWTQPYPKPIIYNHDVETEATGRVHTASFTEFTSAGRPGIIVVPKISHPKAIQDILDGRLLTVSIGATTDSAICSVCGTDIINEGYCGHMKGEVYEGETVQWTCGNLWFDELSWVNVPADQDAMIVDLGTVFQPTASTEGRESLNITESNGAGNQIKEERDEEKMEELQKQLEDLQAKHDELATQVSELTTEKQTLTEANETLTTELNEVKEELEKANTSVEEQKALVQEKDTALTEATQELNTVKTELDEVKEAREQLVTANTELAADVHESTVQHVVSLRLALGKESSKEDALAKFKERSLESLKDSIADLATESVTPVAPATRTVERVENPATTTTTATESTSNTLSDVDALKKLFGGK